MAKILIVQGESGGAIDCDDYKKWNVKAFMVEAHALAYQAKCEQMSKGLQPGETNAFDPHDEYRKDATGNSHHEQVDYRVEPLELEVF